MDFAFINYKKAFDSINHEFLVKALQNQGIEKEYIKLIIQMYKTLKAKVITDIEGEHFEINKRVKQGILHHHSF